MTDIDLIVLNLEKCGIKITMFTTQPTAYPDAPWHNTARVNALKQPSPQQREQRRIQREAAAARIFHPPSLNQGFKYLQ
ncbi:hypothetical protein G6F37_014162 [Rhizopus arrhizus]|nr:hypothetical protein G6F37_014162 [Rhizopus arrhizus]